MKKQLFLDTECYRNYFLIYFKDLEGNSEYFIKDEDNVLNINRIKTLLLKTQTIGFNSRMYDLPLIIYALNGASNSMLKNVSDMIINESSYDTICKYGLWAPKDYDHIDLFHLCSGKNSLKMYGARIHTNYLQDLPYDPIKVLTSYDKDIIRKYCANDVDITKNLYLHLKQEIDIRVDISNEYKIDVRSKSEAQIAEALIEKQLKFNNKTREGFEFKYIPPDYINFKTKPLKDLLETFTSINFKGNWGDSLIDKKLIDNVIINNSTYSCGVGGLHSQEEARTIFANDNEYIIDVDVVSYYPSIILNNIYCPENYNKEDFYNFYKKIFERRLIAKKEKDVKRSNVYKIFLNGLYGKYGDKYSSLYSPNSLANVTITGQLSVLMLIERLEEYDFAVLSANTDGVTVKVQKNKYDLFKKVITNWENKIKFKTEEVKYKSMHNQNVNSYIIIKEDGSLKCKGAFSSGDLSRNPAIKVCKEAIFNFLLNKTKIEDSILNYKKDPENFILVRKCKDGAYWKGEYLGKVTRWYWSLNGEPITNLAGHKVSNSDYAFPIMDLNDGLVDINYDKYIKETYDLLASIGM